MYISLSLATCTAAERLVVLRVVHRAHSIHLRLKRLKCCVFFVRAVNNHSCSSNRCVTPPPVRKTPNQTILIMREIPLLETQTCVPPPSPLSPEERPSTGVIAPHNEQGHLFSLERGCLQ